MTTHWTERLSEFHDGDLSPAEYADCAAHLAVCGVCRNVLQELHLVAVAARADAGRDPSVDLWPGVLARISGVAQEAADAAIRPPAAPGAVAAFTPRDEKVRQRRQITFSLPQLALAASLLIAVSSGVAYLATQRNSVAGTAAVAQLSAPREAPIRAVAEPLGAATTGILPANFADAQYDKAVSDLERTLMEQRDKLDPRTVVVIERNLATIDDAIRQAREALDADPANTYLNSHLADARRRKLELLRRATSIAGD